MKKLFTKFAVEPTFYFDTSTIKIPKYLEYIFDIDDLLENASTHVESILDTKSGSKKHPWAENAYEDGNSLEIPSIIYDDKITFIKDYDKLTNLLKNEFCFIPSSLVDIETEGGCHLNVSIPTQIANSSSVKKFFDNLQAYLTNNPSIIWSFLSPTDNESSVVPFKQDPRFNTKGEFFTIRDKDGDEMFEGYYPNAYFQDVAPEDSTIDKRNNRIYFSYKGAARLELRFFMQPRTSDEMKLEIDFGLHLLNWIWQQTTRGKDWQPENTKSSLRAYTAKKALAEIKLVCSEMEFNYNRLVECGKIDNLKEKFKYNINYLR
jgi:hypothetical protein